MNLEDLFAVAALLAAVYTIIPIEKRMGVSFYLGRIGVAITCLSFLIIICLHYYHIFFMLDMSPPQFNVLGYILTPYDASFVVFFVAVIMIISIYLMGRKIRLPYKIVKFHELILHLYIEEKYSEILLLVRDNLNWIKKVSKREFWLFNIYRCFVPDELETDLERGYKIIENKDDNTNISTKKHVKSWWHRFFSGGKEVEVVVPVPDEMKTDLERRYKIIENKDDNMNISTKKHVKSWWRRFFSGEKEAEVAVPVPDELETDLERRYKIIKNKDDNTNISTKKHVKSWWHRFFSGEKEAKVAYQIINMIQTDKSLIKVMALNRNDIAISILGQQFGKGKEFADIYLSYLIKDKNSMLYSKLWKGKDGDEILDLLFFDCRMAIYLNAWQPIGEYVIEELNELYIRKDMSPDVYNNFPELYEEYKGDRFREESPLFTGVLFFNEMVNRALKQNIKHHMRLLYFRYFVERILRNLSPNKDINMEYIIPTHYHSLLCDIVVNILSWIDVVRHDIPRSQENIRIESENIPIGGGGIMESIISTLGYVIYQIMTCDENKTSRKFKFYIIEMVYSRYFDLIKINECEIYAKALIRSVRHGDIIWSSINQTSLQYKETLLEAANNNEVVDMAINGKFVKGLREILQDDIDKH